MDSHDDESSNAPEIPTPAGSKQRQRAKNRVRHHLETLLTSMDPKALEASMSLLEQISVQLATRLAYQKAMQVFLEWCDSQTPPADLDVPHIADLALCAYGNELYARGHHKSSFERAVAAFLFHLPEFGRMGSKGLPRTYRALRGFRLRCPGRSRKPHPRSFWQALAVDLAERGHVMMAVWVLLAFQTYMRPGECMSLQRRDLVPPSSSVNNFWVLLFFPSERSQRSKIGEADNSILLDSTWAQWMSQVWETIYEKHDASSVWSFTYPTLVKEVQKSSLRHGVPVVPYQCRHSGASDDRATQARSLQEIQKRGQWKSAKSVNRYEKSARLGQSYAQYPIQLQAWIENVSPRVEAVVLGRQSAGSLPP